MIYYYILNDKIFDSNQILIKSNMQFILFLNKLINAIKRNY